VPTVNDPNCDAELIALGERFEAIYKRFAPLDAEHSRLGGEAHDYAHRRSGWAGSDPEGDHDPKLVARFLEELGQISERNGFDACDKRHQALHRELYPIMRDITCTPASSLAGLRVKTLVAIVANPDLWHETCHDLDRDKEVMRSVIEAVCVVTGIPVPQEQLDEGDDDDDATLSHPGSAALN
jgi:hypothetical protein